MAVTPEPIARFLEAMRGGDWTGFEDAYTDDAIFDASVPNWHFQWEGAAMCAAQLGEWFGIVPDRFEPTVTLTEDGAVVDFEMRRMCPGNPAENHAPHVEGTRQAHIFRLRDGKICEQRVYCAGEWLEDDWRKIDAEAPKVDRTTSE
jgi:ketosteroid isomerase-like protein